MKEINECKKKQGQRIEKYFLKEKEHLLKLEQVAPKKCHRLDYLYNMLLQPFKVVNHSNINRYLYNDHEQSVLDFILNEGWKTNIRSMENSKGIFS